ncbi:MAG TPA: carbohydrate binding family 9 domain-containing protein, partial [Chitinophagaceae bacterium]|nr:carbohydrate binding family 9 domain-containing protein [Chitinophagaceae bacterium]
MRKFSLILFSFHLINASYSQQINNENYQQEYQLRIAKAIDAIKIDGELNEASWQTAHTIKNFWQKQPVDTGRAQRQTEVRTTYDGGFIYFGITCYDTSYYVIQTLKRDVDPGGSDGIGIVIDPVNGRTNGFLFTVSPYNVQAEDQISAGSSGEINFSWDNKWFSQTTRHHDRWIVEIAIPFKTLRYEAGKTIWGVNFIRSDRKNNEYSTWTKVPINLQFHDFGYTGALIWDAPPPPPGRNISIIPYATGAISRNKEDGEKTDGELNQGFDAKIAISSKLNLDLTVNPDFSQIEVDRQVT